MDPVAGKYQLDRLQDLIPQDSGWEIVEAQDINDYGCIIATGTNAQGQNHGLLLLPVEIVDGTGNGVSTLKIANMTAPDVLSGSYNSYTQDLDSVALDPEKDPNRYYVRINGAAHIAASGTIGIETRGNPNPAYDDPGNDLQLTTKGSDLMSKSLLLTSDDIDNYHSVEGITNDSLNDRTHRIQLDGKFRINKIHLGQISLTPNLDYPVKAYKHLNFRVTILRLTPGGQPVIDSDAVNEDIKFAQERYAQVGITLSATVRIADPPNGVDLSDGFWPMNPYFSLPTTELADLLGKLSTPSIEDIDVIYVNYIPYDPNRTRGSLPIIYGFSLLPGDMVALPSYIKYTNNIIMSAERRPFVLAHELGHILKQDGAHAPATDSVKVMRDEGTSASNTVGGSKRFTDTEINTIQDSPLLH